MKKDGFLGHCQTIRPVTLALTIVVLLLTLVIIYEIGDKLEAWHLLLMVGSAVVLLVPSVVVAWHEVLVTTNLALPERHNECGNCGGDGGYGD